MGPHHQKSVFRNGTSLAPEQRSARRGDERELRRRTRVLALAQSGSRHQGASRAGAVELDPGQRADHAPDRLRLGDITYLPTGEGWLYLAVLLDTHSRRVVGRAMADHLRAELALDALMMALGARRPPPGLVHRTDRGCQYTAASYRETLATRGLACSMRRSGDCLDNAMAERFFSTLKAELLGSQPWPTRAAARTATFEWIEAWYNRQRRHSALADRAPVAHEALHVLLLQDPAA